MLTDKRDLKCLLVDYSIARDHGTEIYCRDTQTLVRISKALMFYDNYEQTRAALKSATAALMATIEEAEFEAQG